MPHAAARIITNNGPQFIARDFKEFIRLSGMTHIRTSPYYPQSNGKIERWHQSLKHECIRPGTPLNIDNARRIVARYVDQYNKKRLHSAIGYISPADKLAVKKVSSSPSATKSASRQEKPVARCDSLSTYQIVL